MDIVRGVHFCGPAIGSRAVGIGGAERAGGGDEWLGLLEVDTEKGKEIMTQKKETWSWYRETKEGRDTDVVVLKCDDGKTVQLWRILPAILDEDAESIVKSLNACVGLPDPKVDIKALAWWVEETLKWMVRTGGWQGKHIEAGEKALAPFRETVKQKETV